MRTFSLTFRIVFCLLTAACGTLNPPPTLKGDATSNAIHATAGQTAIATKAVTASSIFATTLSPSPTFTPTIASNELPNLLTTNLTLIRESDISDFPLRRITGWRLGFRSADYCHEGPYIWLDSEHLLLLPIIGRVSDFYTVELTRPTIINTDTGKVWLPPPNSDLSNCRPPAWSTALQSLIIFDEDEVLIFTPEGEIVKRFPGYAPLYLSPSGRKLIAYDTWHDLESGRTVILTGGIGDNPPAWSADETQLFACCFLFADANQGEVYSFGWPYVVGRGISFVWNGHTSRMLLDDKLGLAYAEVEDENGSPTVPLFDLVSKSYIHVSVLVEPLSYGPCEFVELSADEAHMLVRCSDAYYWINLQTLKVEFPPEGYFFAGWSPHGQFTLLTRQDGTPAVLVKGGSQPFNIITETPPIWSRWSPSEKRLLFLLTDKRTVVIFNTSTYQTRQFHLPTPIEPINVFWSAEDQNVFLQTVEGEMWWLAEFTDVSPHEPITPLDLAVRTAFWNPQHDTLAMLTKDNSLWAIHNMSAPTITPLTTSLPDIHTVRWSPDGHHVAFVNGSDIYIISLP
jgi:hypothetical protein